MVVKHGAHRRTKWISMHKRKKGTMGWVWVFLSASGSFPASPSSSGL
jgi:hypothetical protein